MFTIRDEFFIKTSSPKVEGISTIFFYFIMKISFNRFLELFVFICCDMLKLVAGQTAEHTYTASIKAIRMRFYLLLSVGAIILVYF